METVGAILIPILISVTDFVGKMAKKFDALSGPVKTTIVAFFGALAVLGPVLFVVGKLIPVIGKVMKAVKLLGIAIKFVMASSFGPWLLVIAAVIAIGILIWKHWVTIKERLLAVWEIIKKAFDVFMQAIKEIWEGIWNAIVAIFTAIWDGITLGIKLYIDTIKLIITTQINIIKGIWNTVWGAVRDTAVTVWETITGAVTGAIDLVKSTISGAIDTITGWWGTFTGALSSMWSSIWDTLGDGIDLAFGGVVSVIEFVLNGILKGLETAINLAVGALNVLINAANFLNPFGDVFSNVGKVDFGRVSLAEGGMTTNAGPVRVGERGPETLILPAGSSIQPNGAGGGVNFIIEKLVGGDPKEMAAELGWYFTKRGMG